MITISVEKIINSNTERVWEIISDIDNDPKYWHGIKSVKNTKSNGNITERQTVIAFRRSSCKEIISLVPKRKIDIKIINCPFTGHKIIELETVANNDSKIKVTWIINLKGPMKLATFIIKKHIRKGTQEALDRIAIKAEGYNQ